ncbi:zinc-ribbon domain-containing protein [Caballeronia novacaledonica]|uniref:zinc-ribbon domain-containing protein n=1 Tax=Caballeronia novacaledonica TaxID=1544861 RepID=UPI001EE13FAE|nr:zinc-ribbon domain-containing protein [Caballeronia novacaledonica]
MQVHHGDQHARGAHHSDEGHRYSGEEWGRAPGSAPTPRASVNCPKCSAANAEGSRFCGQCGTSIVPQTCSQCNQTLAQGAKFCSACGTPVKP